MRQPNLPSAFAGSAPDRSRGSLMRMSFRVGVPFRAEHGPCAAAHTMRPNHNTGSPAPTTSKSAAAPARSFFLRRHHAGRLDVRDAHAARDVDRQHDRGLRPGQGQGHRRARKGQPPQRHGQEDQRRRDMPPPREACASREVQVPAWRLDAAAKGREPAAKAAPASTTGCEATRSASAAPDASRQQDPRMRRERPRNGHRPRILRERSKDRARNPALRGTGQANSSTGSRSVKLAAACCHACSNPPPNRRYPVAVMAPGSLELGLRRRMPPRIRARLHRRGRLANRNHRRIAPSAAEEHHPLTACELPARSEPRTALPDEHANPLACIRCVPNNGDALPARQT
jgi:hypothetical protein